MLDIPAVQNIFFRYHLGVIASANAHHLEAFHSATARVWTDTGLYTIFPIAKPFKIGGGIHLQIVLPQAVQTIGPAALLILCDETDEEALPTIEMAGQYWVIFKADASVVANQPKIEVQDFVEYKSGKVSGVQPEYDDAGYVTAIHRKEADLSVKTYAVFFPERPQPEYRSNTAGY